MQEKSVLTGHLSELKQKIENGLEELKSSKELYEFKSEYLEGKKSRCIQYFCHCGYPPGQHQSESAGRCQESGAGIPCGHAFFESP